MVSEIIETIVSTVSQLGVGLGSAIVEMFETLFLTAEGGLSNMAVWSLVFVGLGFTFGFVRWLTKRL